MLGNKGNRVQRGRKGIWAISIPAGSQCKTDVHTYQ